MNELLLFFFNSCDRDSNRLKFLPEQDSTYAFSKNTTNFSGFLVDFDEFLYFDHLNFK